MIGCRSKDKFDCYLIVACASVILVTHVPAQESVENVVNGSATALADRIQQINTARLERPDIFRTIEPFHEGVSQVIPSVVSRSIVHLRQFTLDVLHPIHREAIDGYPEVYSTLKVAYDERRAGRAWEDLPTGFWQEWSQERRRIFDASNIPSKTFRLIAAAVAPTQIERLDPEYLLAWEAALLNPEVPTIIKARIAGVVASFEDPASTPILGEVARRAHQKFVACDVMVPKTEKECDALRTLVNEVCRSFLQRPRRDIAIELSALMIQTQANSKSADEALVLWGRKLSNNRDWLTLIHELENDPDARDRIALLRSAVRRYQQSQQEKQG